ncbi:TMEM175 family protein [Curtobacterium citreum]|uniref:TMEM175 family protein n=1 Tax=Curtobacterium citreum TaxID=2036 RepID=UPI002543A7F5|nr:TMEM175 family protein [Curtobacterium citreum]WIJ46540.1 TMEM175 family protein [Curtobacterium citreum]
MSAPARTERGLDRLVNFSDATVAIAITLLVLPLVDLAGELRDGESVGSLLAEHWPAIIAFVVTFWVISRFWTLHHQVFEHVQSYSPRVLRLNFVWLISIVFLPFAANLLNAGKEDDRLTYALYLGTMLVTSLSLTAIEFTLRRSPELLSSPLPDVRKGLIAAGLLALALVLAVLFPTVGMLWVLLLLLQGTVARSLRSAEDRRR